MIRILALLLLLACAARADDAGSLSGWRRSLSAADRTEREAAARRLVDLGPAGWLMIEALARDADPRIRAALAGGLRGMPGGLALLERGLLDDPDAHVRSAAARSLLLDGPPRTEALLRGRQSLDPAVRYWAGVKVHRELQALLPPGGWLLGVYPGMFDTLRSLGALATGPLLQIAGHPQSGRRAAFQALACEALGELRPAAAAGPLQALYDQLDRRQRELRESAAVALHKLGRTEEVERLIEGYRRRSYWGRRNGFVLFRLGQLLQRIGAVQDAIDAFELAHQGGADRWHAMIHYNLACLHAPRKRERALHHLEQALQNGFDEPAWIARDRRLDPIRGDARFRKLLAAR